MRSPHVVLDNLQQKARDAEYRFERLYRNLYNPDFYTLAYQNIYANAGAMTPGADEATLDGISLERIQTLVRTLKDHSYQPQPARRVYIPKKSGGQRPLGIASAHDKLVQEVVRMLLESIYEPTFSPVSHGFRPGRSCHTALAQIQVTFTGVKWFVEGDIKAYFDSIDHHVLINILRRRIHDEPFIELLWKLLKAGYLEDWQHHATYSGTPQGAGCSPILANLYLNELDQYMAAYKTAFDQGSQRGPNKEYGRVRAQYLRLQKQSVQQEGNQSREERWALKQQLLKIPAKDPMDAKYRRIQYVRYADDFLVGVIGSKADAEAVKADIGRFLADALKLTLSPAKTLVTHGQDKARFLGYDVTIGHNLTTRRTVRGPMRVFSHRVQLYAPKDCWVGKLQELGVLKIASQRQGPERWSSVPRLDYVGMEPHEIVWRYNAQIRGLYNYYRLARNATVLHKFYYVMEYSLYKTLAVKFRSTVGRVRTRYTHAGVFRIEYQSPSGPRRVTLCARSFPRMTMPLAAFIDTLPEAHSRRPKEIFFRMKASRCELCRACNVPVSVHQIPMLKALSGVYEWERVMLTMRRKTLMVCESCHQAIHAVDNA